MPAPMPLEPPVTRATLPLNDFACICHQNPPSHLLCPFWIILSRMRVQANSFPGCPIRSFFLSLWFSQRVHRQRKALDEPTSGLSAIRKQLGSAPRTATSIPGSPSSARHRRVPQQNLPQRRTPDGLVALRQIPTKLRYP